MGELVLLKMYTTRSFEITETNTNVTFRWLKKRWLNDRLVKSSFNSLLISFKIYINGGMRNAEDLNCQPQTKYIQRAVAS